MINVFLYNILTFIYLISTLFYLIYVAFQKRKIGVIATTTTLFACIGHVIAFIYRWVESYQAGRGHLPIRGPYECLTFSAGVITLLYLVIEFVTRRKVLGVIILPCISIMMLFANFTSDIKREILPMPEVLQGNYINYHLFSCFVGYAAFIISFVASLLYLLNKGKIITADNVLQRIFLPEEFLDEINYKMIAIGFIMFSIMLVTGMFRSKIVWGRYWQWDPVQTWSLLTWIVYAIILHGRYIWRQRRVITALLSIIGFGFSIVSFLIGAGFLLVSLHFPITGE